VFLYVAIEFNDQKIYQKESFVIILYVAIEFNGMQSYVLLGKMIKLGWSSGF